MYSMTGYGKAEYKGDVEITVEIKTVNNRFLDLNFKYPRSFMCFDDLLRKRVQKKLSRGRIDVFINFVDKREGVKSYVCDAGLAKSYLDAVKTLAQKTSIADDFALSHLLKVPDILTLDEKTEDNETLSTILTAVVDEALDKLNEMRHIEGEKLVEDMLNRAGVIKIELEKIENRAPVVATEYREKLKKRMSEILGAVEIEEARIVSEAAVFADRCNIDEEITRLKSHIEQFINIIKDERAGKRLDFLIQEFNREANTICSKSNDIAVTNAALTLKCEIEKIREQIQNLE